MEQFEFEAILKSGPQKGVFADFPFDCQAVFGSRKAIAVKVEIDNKYAGEMSLLPCGNGKHWLHLKKNIRMAIGKSEGDTVFIRLEKNENPSKPEVPEYLQWLLDDDPKMQRAFERMPRSAHKFWLGYIEETKDDDAKVEKINRFFEFLANHYVK